MSEAASLLQNRDEQAVPKNRVISSLHSCEQQLAHSRFVRRRDEASGRTITIRVAGVESALIHVSQALVSLEKPGSLDVALENIEGALEDIALIGAGA